MEDLLLVVRFILYNRDGKNRDEKFETVRFKVFKVDVEGRGLAEVEDMGNNVIFVGSGSSTFSVQAVVLRFLFRLILLPVDLIHYILVMMGGLNILIRK